VALTHRLGFDCDAVGDGDGALQSLNGNGEPAVILLDLLVPGIDGFELMRRLDESRPHLLERIIVVTAAGDGWLNGHDELKRVWCVRRKPLDIVELGEQMKRCARKALEVVRS
jgi:two-component system response regulator CpxR